MNATTRTKALHRGLTLPYAYAIATGATLSSGFFLLPGIAFAQAGPAMILAYTLAAVPLIPGVLSKAELATAMPRAGGEYFFLDRSMGPLFGTVAGVGTWFALVLKTAFALVGMGAYVGIFVAELPLVEITVALAVALGVVNWLGVSRTGAIQAGLVLVLFVVLAWFLWRGAGHLEPARFAGFMDKGWDAVIATSGMVCVGYVGLSKIASVSEEIRHPERTIPLSMFLALVTAVVVYLLGTTVMVGVLPAAELRGSLTPVADTAAHLGGRAGALVLSVAAVLAFTAVANAGILSASRYPLAMSRDHLVPRAFRLLSRHRTPSVSIAVTVAAVLFCVVVFDPTRIAKLASSFQLLLFAGNCLGVLIMRESRIESYDPGYRSPLYPWLHLAGVAAPLWLVSRLGGVSILFCAAVVLAGVAWYFHYGRPRVARSGAMYHVFERWGRQRDAGLDTELRVIMKEKGSRVEDPFDEVVARADVVDLGAAGFDEVVGAAAQRLAGRLPLDAATFARGFLEGTRVGATPVEHGVAIPHLRLAGVTEPRMVMVRCTAGVGVPRGEEPLGGHDPDTPVYAFFFVVSPEENPTQHLRLLAHLAARADDERFIDEWLAAASEERMREVMLREECFLSLLLRPGTRSGRLAGRAVGELELPGECLVAVVHRHGVLVFPDASTVLEDHDRVTVIGQPAGIRVLKRTYAEDEGTGAGLPSRS